MAQSWLWDSQITAECLVWFEPATSKPGLNRALQNLMRRGLKSIHGGSMRGLKMLSKYTCEGVHLIVMLPAICLQACKFTKNDLLHTFLKELSQILSYYLLCFFQESFHEGCFTFQWKVGGCFSDGGCPFDGFFLKKPLGLGAPPPHYGKPIDSPNSKTQSFDINKKHFYEEKYAESLY